MRPGVHLRMNSLRFSLKYKLTVIRVAAGWVLRVEHRGRHIVENLCRDAEKSSWYPSWLVGEW